MELTGLFLTIWKHVKITLFGIFAVGFFVGLVWFIIYSIEHNPRYLLGILLLAGCYGIGTLVNLQIESYKKHKRNKQNKW
jgi:hypothetical protein